MSMNVRPPSGGGGDDELSPVAEINVTPLVDVMLVLLIIFMVTAPIMMSQLPIMLPKVSLEQANKPPNKLTVSFDINNNYFVQLGDDAPKEQLAYTDLPARLKTIADQDPDRLVTVCADKDVIYDRVVDLMGIVSAFFKNKVSICP
jgi:biopolymer transport protein ExbD